MWFYNRVMQLNDADSMANSVAPDQAAPVCPDIFIQKLRIFMVSGFRIISCLMYEHHTLGNSV